MKNHFEVIGLSLCALAMTGSVHGAATDNAAPAETNSVVELPAVKVTASPITQEERVSADGAETVVLGRGQLGALNAQDIQTALRQVPGVTISRYAPIGSYGGGQGGSVYIRGAGTARPGGEIRLYTDGAPRESGVWGHPLMDSMPIDFAQGLTVYKNPHPGHLGGAFGGVDVMTRRRTEDGWEGEAETAIGRYGTFLAATSVGAKEAGIDAYGGLSYKRSNGLRSHNDSELATAFARFGIDLSEFEHVGFVYQNTDSKVEDPGEKHGTVPLRDRFDLATDLYTIRFDTKGRDHIEGHTLVYVEHGDIAWRKDHMTDGNLTSPPGDTDTTWLNWGTRSRYDVNPWANLWLTGAFDAASEGGHTKNVREVDGVKVFGFKGRFVSVSPYVGARYDFQLSDAWKFTPSAGIRYHHHSAYDDEWAPNAALKLAWEDRLEFFANASRGVHYPGIYTRAMANDFARHTLNAEKLDYLAVGAKAKWDETADVTVTAFHTDAKDRIDRTATGYINSGNTRASGVEVSAHWTPVDALSLFAGGAFTAPETHPVSRLPRWTGSAGATWKICDYLKWSVDGQYIGSMYAYSVRAEADAQNLRRLDDALIFNTRLAVPLESFLPKVEGEIYLSLENLTSENYCYYPGYSMGGTMWYVGCRVKF